MQSQLASSGDPCCIETFQNYFDVRRGISQLLFLKPFLPTHFSQQNLFACFPTRYMWMALPAFGLFLPSPMWHMKRQAPVMNVKITKSGVHGKALPIGSMYGIFRFTYISHKNQSNVGKYTIHGSYGLGKGS